MRYIEIEEGSSTVTHDGRAVEAGGPITGFWEHGGRLLITSERADELVLEIFDGETHERTHTIHAPEGWSMYLLTKWVDDQPAIVCSAAEPINYHQDWHFVIDVETGELTRTSPWR